MFTYDEQGYPESGSAFFQVKATEHVLTIAGDWVCDVEVRDFRLWMSEQMPVILVEYEAARKQAVWISITAYFRDHPARWPKRGATKVRIRIPAQQRLDGAAIATIRALKNEAIS